MRLRDMLPTLARQDAANLRAIDAEVLRQFALRALAGCMATTNLLHIDSAQLRLLALIAKRHALLDVAITRVVIVRAQEQMIRATAGRRVAMVACQQAGWYRAVCQFVGHAMRELIVTVTAEQAIAPRDGRPLPQPAFARAVNLRPETFGYRPRTLWHQLSRGAFARTESAFGIREGQKFATALFADSGNGRLRGHAGLLRQCAAPGAAPTAPRHPVSPSIAQKSGVRR